MHGSRRFLLIVLLCSAIAAHAQSSQGRIEGRVTDMAGQPVAGLAIAVRGTEVRAITAADGTFAVPAIDGGSYVITARSSVSQCSTVGILFASRWAKAGPASPIV